MVLVSDGRSYPFPGFSSGHKDLLLGQCGRATGLVDMTAFHPGAVSPLRDRPSFDQSTSRL